MNKWFCNRVQPSAATDGRTLVFITVVTLCFLGSPQIACAAHEAPDWMRAAASKPLPSYHEKTNAVLLYSDTTVTVVSKDKIRTRVREAYKILRPQGRRHGLVEVYTFGRKRVTSMRGWCIPASGKDYEVLDKDTVEESPMADGYILTSDLKLKLMRIPAPDPGNVVGYEYEIEEDPFFFQSEWQFQEADPVRESRFRIELPDGWDFKSSWMNHTAIAPSKAGPNTWEWTVSDVPGIEPEEQMPPFQGLTGKMIAALIPPGGAPEHNEFATWNDMGQWYSGVVGERDASTAPIKQEVNSLIASDKDSLAKMQAVAEFIQREIRYVGIELGIGGWQPHSAADVFTNRYGDCKDKATLTIAMLRSFGIDAYYVIINASRGAINPSDPAYNGFNHAITAIRLPDDVQDPAIVATLVHPKLGRLLFFDPTDEVTPFGRIRGQLQANNGLLVGPDGGELIQLPKESPALTGIRRSAALVLNPDGTLEGKVVESRIGNRALEERMRLRAASSESDKAKLVEGLLSDSLGTFQITKSEFTQVNDRSQPLGLLYAFQAPGYGRNAGDMLLVRPRVVGSKSSGLLETDQARLLPIEFPSPELDSDDFRITIPPGYEVVDLSPPVDADYGFASYHSRTEFKNNVLRYKRTFEIRDVTVPASQAAELKRFYRIIATDERSTVILKRTVQAQAP